MINISLRGVLLWEVDTRVELEQIECVDIHVLSNLLVIWFMILIKRSSLLCVASINVCGHSCLYWWWLRRNTSVWSSAGALAFLAQVCGTPVVCASVQSVIPACFNVGTVYLLSCEGVRSSLPVYHGVPIHVQARWLKSAFELGLSDYISGTGPRGTKVVTPLHVTKRCPCRNLYGKRGWCGLCYFIGGILGHHHPMWTSIFALNVSGVTLGRTTVLTLWTLPSASFQVLAYFKKKKEN